MLEVKNIDVAIGPVTVLRGVSLEVPTGAMVGVIGRNGAGKTTLMRSVMGLIRLRGGFDHLRRMPTSLRSPRMGARSSGSASHPKTAASSLS